MPVALITGASRGLGAALAATFWDAGHDLCLVARDPAALEALRTTLPQRPDQRCAPFPADLADADAPQTIVERALAIFGHIDTLINNAAIQGPIGPLWDNDWGAWTSAIGIDLLAPVALCRAVLPSMVERRSGSVINVSGGGATGPRANFTAYATAKAGLVRFSETLAVEVADYGIRVNCIAPGAMKTDMLKDIIAAGSAGERENASARKVLADGGTPPIAAAQLALFLASDDSRAISGRLISAVWDRWEDWPAHADELAGSDAYTLRRIAGRDRGLAWGDK